MNFRQRLSWLLLCVYLGASLVVALYVSELSERYGAYSLQHERSDHHQGGAWGLWRHLADVPFYLWLVLALVPYLQLFWVLLVCTKSEPKLHVKACCVPFIGWFHLCSVACHPKDPPCSQEPSGIRV